MARIYLFFAFFSIVFQTVAQQHTLSPGNTEQRTDRLTIDSFSYHGFLNGEEHSNFTVGYRINDRFLAELQGFYDTYLLSDVVRLALRGNYYVGDKFYFFSGIAAESERDKANGLLSTPRLYILNGSGYDFNRKLNLEIKHEFQFNKAGLGNYGLPSSLSVQGRYKF